MPAAYQGTEEAERVLCFLCRQRWMPQEGDGGREEMVCRRPAKGRPVTTANSKLPAHATIANNFARRTAANDPEECNVPGPSKCAKRNCGRPLLAGPLPSLFVSDITPHCFQFSHTPRRQRFASTKSIEANHVNELHWLVDRRLCARMPNPLQYSHLIGKQNAVRLKRSLNSATIWSAQYEVSISTRRA